MENHSTHVLSAVRLAAAGGVTAALVFMLCWAGMFIPFSGPIHAYIGLFSPAETQSTEALLQGTLWSLLFGALSGALFAWIYNLFGGLERRG